MGRRPCCSALQCMCTHSTHPSQSPSHRGRTAAFKEAKASASVPAHDTLPPSHMRPSPGRQQQERHQHPPTATHRR